MSENKVFVLPLNKETDIAGRAAIISLASTLANNRIPLHPVDRIYCDPSYRNSQALASFIQHRSVKDCRIALWIITRHFTSEDQAMKMADWYELAASNIGPNTKSITVFLDSGEEINERISKLVQEASIKYFVISSNNLKVSENKEFANLSNTLYQILYPRDVQEPPNCIYQYHQYLHCKFITYGYSYIAN